MLPMTPTMHDGQSMIVQGPLVDKPNEPKSMSNSFQPEVFTQLCQFAKSRPVGFDFGLNEVRHSIQFILKFCRSEIKELIWIILKK